MWTTKVVDSHLTMTSRLHDVICGQLSSCCSCKLPVRRSADTLVPSTVSCSMPRSSSCGSRWRCKWLKVVCTKGFLIIVNFLFLLVGLGLALVGASLYFSTDRLPYMSSVLLRDNAEYGHGVPSSPVVVDDLPFIFVAVGLLLSIVSFLGCCGACADSVCFMAFYSLIVMLVIVSELATGIMLIMSKADIMRRLHDGMQYQLLNEYNRTAQSINKTSPQTLQLTRAWDRLQTQWRCCGVLGPQDYMNSSWFNRTEDSDGVFVPLSCCVPVSLQSPDVVARQNSVQRDNYCQLHAILYPKSVNKSDYLNTKGCQLVVVSWVDSYSRHALLSLTAIILLQCGGIMFACSLITWLRQRITDDYWWCYDDEFAE